MRNTKQILLWLSFLIGLLSILVIFEARLTAQEAEVDPIDQLLELFEAEDEPEDEPEEQQTPTIALTAYESRLINLTNEHRRNNSLQPLMVSAELMRQARIWSQTQSNRRRMGHSGWGSENVAWHSASQAAGDPSGRLFRQWRSSRGHNRNMLGGHRYIGVGVVVENGRTYGTQRFSGSQPSYRDTSRGGGGGRLRGLIRLPRIFRR